MWVAMNFGHHFHRLPLNPPDTASLSSLLSLGHKGKELPSLRFTVEASTMPLSTSNQKTRARNHTPGAGPGRLGAISRNVSLHYFIPFF